MVKLKQNGKVKAATILETIISFTIIIIVFGIALSVLNNLMRTENMHTRFEANILIEKYFENVTDTLGPNNITYKGFHVERTFLPYQQDTNLFILAIKVYDRNNKLITKQKEILYLNNLSTINK